jgi:hypothetical protein
MQKDASAGLVRTSTLVIGESGRCMNENVIDMYIKILNSDGPTVTPLKRRRHEIRNNRPGVPSNATTLS